MAWEEGGKLLDAVTAFYRYPNVCVNENIKLCESFQLHAGTKQGHITSRGSYNLFMDSLK